MCEKENVITIDGPSGVGKSTVSRKVAAVTGYIYLDTGAMYRGVGFFLQEQHIEFSDTELIKKKLKDLKFHLVPAKSEKSDVGVYVNGVDVSEAIRTPAMSMIASTVSALPVVREYLTKKQQLLGVNGRIIAEGRDTGTVVFPNAAYKFYLDAAPEIRARRRYDQLVSQGKAADYESLLKMTIERDKNDSERKLAPLKKADDAVLINTGLLDADGVVAEILRIVDVEKMV
jgi:cytidylate kinase